MKRILSILLSLNLFLITGGIAVNSHFCSGERTDVSLVSSVAKTCGCAVDVDKGCCDEQTEVKQFHEDYTVSGDDIQLDRVVTLVAVFEYKPYVPVATQAIACVHPSNKAPPSGEPLFIIHESFLI